jgi:hypothetical protein
MRSHFICQYEHGQKIKEFFLNSNLIICNFTHLFHQVHQITPIVAESRTESIESAFLTFPVDSIDLVLSEFPRVFVIFVDNFNLFSET